MSAFVMGFLGGMCAWTFATVMVCVCWATDACKELEEIRRARRGKWPRKGRSR